MSNRRVSGFTLVEMVMAIVIISVGLAGVLLALNTAVKASADPLIHKQMLAVAEEMMEEILLKPYAVSGTAPINLLKTCDGASPPSRVDFDDVRDYAGYQTTGICDIDGAAVAGLGAYSLSVTVVSTDWQGIAGTLLITVDVRHDGEMLSLDGWRTGYAS
ncbi:MAG: hypothetical protein H6R17_1850 [Proteobacteria bacterium]|nr:hypothetical protein [Pseudomonadota bacterium]